MSHEPEYITKLLSQPIINEFIQNTDESQITDPHTRAIISTLKNSIIALNLKFNPIQISPPPSNKSLEVNQPHKQ